MKIHPQTIYNGKNAEFIVLSIAEYKRLIRAVEDIEDVEEINNFNQKPSETFPLELVEQLSKGINPIKVYREYRGFSQEKLAKQIKVSKQYISQLENRDRKGTIKVLRAIAKALRVDIDDITD